MKPSDNRLSRRRWFAGASALGAVATVAAVAPRLVPSAGATPQAEPVPEQGGGYRLSEHIQRYYQTARV